MKENEIRDLICQNINIIGSDLTLIDKEKFIPNNLGTRSFIDIYAKDRNNSHVLIELKRSNHEVIKYAEGIKSYFGANDDEIRLIIASTEWDELLVPFSSLIHNTSFNLTGLKITITDKNLVTEEVIPLKYNNGRFITPFYTAYWFKNESSLNQGVSSIQGVLNNAGISNFVLCVLESETPIVSPSKERRKEVLLGIAKLQGIETKNFAAEVYSYIVFLSYQAMSVDQQLDIIKKTKSIEVFEEASSYISDLEENQQEDVLYEYTLDLPNIHYDDMEIGNPAKLSIYLLNSQIRLKEIIRNGFFKENLNLSEDVLLQELLGYKGNSAQRLFLKVDLSDSQQSNNLINKINDFLETNSVWKNQVLQVINDIKKSNLSSSIQLDIYHPRMALFSIYYTLKNNDTNNNFLPYYLITINDNSGSTLNQYYGCLKENFSGMTFDDLINKHYEGSIHNLLHTITWGGADDRDEEILDDAGLSYMSFYKDSTKNKNYSLINNKWRECEDKTIFDYFLDFINQNSTFTKDLMSEISLYDQGDMFSTPNIDTHIIVQRSEIEELDTSKVTTFFKKATSSKAIARYLQGEIDISINGYDDDGELFIIPAVRDYLRKLNEDINSFFFFINPNGVSGFLKILYLAFTEIKSHNFEIDGTLSIELDRSGIKPFFDHQFLGLNELTDYCGMTNEENKKITYSVFENLGLEY